MGHTRTGEQVCPEGSLFPQTAVTLQATSGVIDSDGEVHVTFNINGEQMASAYLPVETFEALAGTAVQLPSNPDEVEAWLTA